MAKAIEPSKPAYDYGSMAGAGFENQTQADVKIPFLAVIQKLSPEVEEGNSKFIPGAKDGDLFNTVTHELYDGATGVILQPCDTSHVAVEWKPRDAGGGFVGIHQIDSEYFKAAVRERDQRKMAGGGDKKELNRIKTPNGTELIETFYIYGNLLNGPSGEIITPIMVAFSSTKIGVYRSIMTRLRTVKGRPPLFAHQLRISSMSEKNAQGQPYKNFKITAAVDDNVMKSLIDPDAGAFLLEEGSTLLHEVRQGLLSGKMDDADSGAAVEHEAF